MIPKKSPRSRRKVYEKIPGRFLPLQPLVMAADAQDPKPSPPADRRREDYGLAKDEKRIATQHVQFEAVE